MWNRNERDGIVDQATGRLKQAVGAATHDNDLKSAGQVEEAMGLLEAAVGRISRAAGDAITRVGKAVKG